MNSASIVACAWAGDLGPPRAVVDRRLQNVGQRDGIAFGRQPTRPTVVDELRIPLCSVDTTSAPVAIASINATGIPSMSPVDAVTLGASRMSGLRQMRRDLFRVLPAEKFDVIADAQFLDARFEFGAQRAVAHDAVMDRETARDQLGHRFDRETEAFLLDPCGRPRAAGPGPPS